jgi:hypothetical protein
MALEAYFVVEDAKGDKSTIAIPFSSIGDWTEIPELVQDLADLIDPLINGGIVTAGMRLEIDVSSVTDGIADALADVQERARFVFRGENGFLKSLHLPTFLETKMVPNSADVNTADADVAAFVTALEDGITLSTLAVHQPSDNRGDDLETLVSATESWGRNRR